MGVAQVATPLAERPARLRSERVSGLPASLVSADPTRSGVAPLGETTRALVLEIRHAAVPLGAGTEPAYLCVRELVPALDEDRPLGVEVERLAGAGLAGGELLARVQAASR